MSKSGADWEAVERDYRMGQLSLRALSEKHGVSASSISRRATKYGWVQDASQEVRERTRAALLVQADDCNTDCNSVAVERNTPTREDIAVAVQTNIEVISRHRKDIAKGQTLVALLFGQLNEAAEHRSLIEEAINDECGDDRTTVRRTAMLKAVSLPSHAVVLRDLSTALKNLIPLERQAFNLDEDTGQKGIEEYLRELAGE